MSLWLCPEHGLFGGQVTCPKCGIGGVWVNLNPPPETSAEKKKRRIAVGMPPQLIAQLQAREAGKKTGK